MSRSYKTHAAGGITTCRSEKRDKRIWHKRWRARTRDALRCRDDSEDWEISIFHVRQISNPWSMGKDGKYWYFPESWRKREAFLSHPGKLILGDTLPLAEAHKLIGK